MQNKQMIETYDQGSTDYDAIMQRYWHSDRQPLIESLQLSPGQTVLDGAVGTRQGGVQVTGVDLSHSMLSRAREKQVSASVTLKVTDLENLPDTGTCPL
jgi:phosphatidylethanolamine/phosphatidyl-N-methylethanolamine N-methyltransferase